MEMISTMHLVTMAIFLAVLLFPLGRILGRAGFSPWWCLLAIIPFVGLIGLWVFAFLPWPSLDQPAGRIPAAQTS